MRVGDALFGICGRIEPAEDGLLVLLRERTIGALLDDVVDRLTVSRHGSRVRPKLGRVGQVVKCPVTI